MVTDTKKIQRKRRTQKRPLFCRYVFHYNGATLFNPQFIDNPVPLLYGERPALLLAVSASRGGEMACVGLS